VLNLAKLSRAEGRVEATLLGFAYGTFLLVQELAAFEGYSDATTAVLELPILVFAGVLMVRLGRLLLNHRESVEGEGEDEGPNFIDRTLSLAGRFLMIVGIVGPVMAALGYANLAGMVVFNTALSFALIGFLLVLHGFFVDLWGMIRGTTTQDARDALTPVLASLAAVILSVPFFALIWGARETDLREIWGTVMRGVTFGETVISPADVVFLIIVFLIGIALTRLIQGMLKTTVLPKTKMDIGGRNAITSGIGYVGIFLAAVIAITSVGINLSSLAVVAGALSVGIGFGLQNIVSNFVSGIILLIERPISEGDWITVGNQMGIVKDISVRSTRIETFDRTDVVIPNSDLISGVVTNYTRGNRVGRLVIDVGVAYGSDTHRVSEILMEIVMDHPMVTVNPEPQVGFMEFGADALMFQIRAILSDVFFILVVRDELNHAIAKRFAEEGIEIPFAQRDLWIRNPESLRGPAATQSDAKGVKNTEPDDPRRDPEDDADPQADAVPDGD
jgi:potassium efflux system protein